MVCLKSFFALILCFSVASQAQLITNPTKLFNFICSTKIPSTTFLFTEEPEHFSVRILHNSGTQYAPFFKRMIVPSDMADLLEKAEVAKNTGDDITVRFAKKNCQRATKEVFSCIGGGESLTSAKKEIKPWQIERSLITEQTGMGEFKKYTVTMTYDIQKKTNEYMMEYQLNECEFLR